MKTKLLFTSLLLLCFCFSTAQDSDYKWTVQGGSSFNYMSSDGADGGMLGVMALYDFSDKLQVGAELGLGFGDMEMDAAIAAAARYFVGEDLFATAEYALTDTAGDGLTIGAGNRFKIGDRVEFNPGLSYGLDTEILNLVMGFAIRF